uniref:Uncharacterized protein n=1 Tax=Sipha flava TaxID=143950 RepID=A0A2S2QEJ6_9HEMI
MCSIPVHTHLIKEPNLDHSKITNSIKNIFEQIYLNMDSVRFPSSADSFQITKRSSCPKCKSSLTSIECFTSEADLTNIKSRGWLKHPNKYLYKLLSVIEDELMNHISKTSVFEDTIEALITKCETFTFPCAEHKDFILAYIIKYYINMRMRQWTR